LALALLGLVFAGCDSAPDDGRTPLELVGSTGKVARLRVEIADTPESRATGLSGRSSLDKNAGMLFVFDHTGAGFWMKDTLIPLSVAFISDCGRIVAIADMRPQTLDLHNTQEPHRFGLEVNQGWFESNGIAVGDSVRLPQALRGAGCA
jgi:uncharacterized membrane protein (UPF0127 family)